MGQRAEVTEVEKDGGNYGGDRYTLKMPDGAEMITGTLDPRLHAKSNQEVHENINNLRSALWGK